MQSHWLDCLFPQGIAVGHVYFFLEDVFPNQPGGGRWLKTPSIMWVPLNVFVESTKPDRPSLSLPAHCVKYHIVFTYLLTCCLNCVSLAERCCLILQRKTPTTTPCRRSGRGALPGGRASVWEANSVAEAQPRRPWCPFLVLFVWFRGKNKKKPEPTWSRRELRRTPTSFFMGLKWSSKRLDARLLL